VCGEQFDVDHRIGDADTRKTLGGAAERVGERFGGIGC
jgi:hypothetical protein